MEIDVGYNLPVLIVSSPFLSSPPYSMLSKDDMDEFVPIIPTFHHPRSFR